MDIIFKAKKMEAMKRSQNKNVFLHNLIFHSLVAFTFNLLYAYPYWFSSMRRLLFHHLPNMFSLFCTHKCLFIVINCIVVSLVVESRLLGSSQSSPKLSPCNEIYDEYVDMTRKLRICGASSTTNLVCQGKREVDELDINFSEEIVDKEVIEQEDHNECIVVNEVTVDNEKEIQVEKEQEQDLGDMEQDLQEGDMEQESQEEKHKSYEDQEESDILMQLTTDELNRRIEEFIDRINTQRWLEAKSLVVCC